MLVAALGDDARASRRIARDDRLDAELADDAAALAERVDVALDGLDVGKPGAARRHQLVMDRHEPFADDEQARTAAADDGCRRRGRRPNSRSGSSRDRLRPRRSRRVRPRRSGRATARRRDRPRRWRYGSSRQARPGMRFSAFLSCALMAQALASIWRAVSRSAGVSTPRGTVSTMVTSIRIPASSARSCSSFSCFSSGEGGSSTKRCSAARR